MRISRGESRSQRMCLCRLNLVLRAFLFLSLLSGRQEVSSLSPLLLPTGFLLCLRTHTRNSADSGLKPPKSRVKANPLFLSCFSWGLPQWSKTDTVWSIRLSVPKLMRVVRSNFIPIVLETRLLFSFSAVELCLFYNISWHLSQPWGSGPVLALWVQVC